MSKAPVTLATRWLKAAGAVYSEHPYAYEEHGGTAVSARELGVAEHQVIKFQSTPQTGDRGDATVRIIAVIAISFNLRLSLVTEATCT